MALGAAAFVLSGLYRGHVEREHADRMGAYLEELAAALEARPDGTLYLQRELSDPLFHRPYSGLYWDVHVEGTTVLRSRSLWDAALATPVANAADGPVHLAGPEGATLRAWSRTLRLPRVAAPVTLRVAADGARVESMAASFTRTLAVSLAVLALGLITAVVAQVRIGLAPLRRLGDAVTALRQGRTERIDGEYPSEVRPLIEDLNAVLRENRELLARARAQAGNLAHALKTPLAVIRNALAAARSGDGAAATIATEVDRMHGAIERHLVRARTGPVAVYARYVEAAPVIEDVVRAVRRIRSDEVRVEVALAAGARFRGDAADLQEIVGNLLDNATKWARSRARIEARVSDGTLEVTVHDDGPGIPPPQRAEAIQRGVRLDTSRPGSGLGLQIVDELCGVHGGRLELADSPLGGLAASVTLPGGAAGG